MQSAAMANIRAGIVASEVLSCPKAQKSAGAVSKDEQPSSGGIDAKIEERYISGIMHSPVL